MAQAAETIMKRVVWGVLGTCPDRASKHVLPAMGPVR